MSNITIGKKIADFTAESTDGKFKLSSLKGKYIILFFYPRDNTPGCTQESIDFSKNLRRFKNLNAEVIGVSRDSLKSHFKFQEKHNLKVLLLSDEDEKICNLFNVIKEKNMYGKKVKGIERSTFIIDPDRKLLQEWRKIKVAGHVDEVLKFIKSLGD